MQYCEYSSYVVGCCPRITQHNCNSYIWTWHKTATKGEQIQYISIRSINGHNLQTHLGLCDSGQLTALASPGIDARAPERTDTRSGLVSSPNTRPVRFSTSCRASSTCRQKAQKKWSVDISGLWLKIRTFGHLQCILASKSHHPDFIMQTSLSQSVKKWKEFESSRLMCELFRIRAVVLIEVRANLSGESESWWHRQADWCHLCQVSTFAAKEILLLSTAISLETWIQTWHCMTYIRVHTQLQWLQTASDKCGT